MAFTRILCILTVCCFTSLFAEAKAAAADFTDCRDETTLLRSLERELAVVNTRRSTFDAICQWPLILTHFWPIKLTHLRTANRQFSASVDSSHLPA